ncbi:formate dehydrogenase accessory sulfurtransferase FdhD [Pararhodonellum marinum]|uniref:formate dehydrogenase accessory sulfurtransferase FdhD n=1 Tax=Pararhodonellum marinum TaxID=2755358 RepID=UPI0018906FB3|nr:formate dehydrogenase accessory sulfurtransferase FdhD [Pararhodonellum marinum]
MKTIAPVAKAKIIRWQQGNAQEVSDLLALEAPLQVRLQFGEGADWQEMELATTMRTPGHDMDWAYGFLFSEGIIKQKEDVLLMRYCKRVKPEEEGNVLIVKLSPLVSLDLSSLKRNFFMNSSCGICGKAAIQSVTCDKIPIQEDGSRVSLKMLVDMQDQMAMEQTIFKYTGGIHGAALFGRDGKLLFLREDIGRHNALDKVIGAALQMKSSIMNNSILLLSGRISFELIQKAAVAKIPIVVAVGAPSSLAIDLAEEKGITAIGFLKSKSFNVYSYPERVDFNI